MLSDHLYIKLIYTLRTVCPLEPHFGPLWEGMVGGSPYHNSASNVALVFSALFNVLDAVQLANG